MERVAIREGKEISAKRINSLDAFKAIAAFLVVILHVGFPGAAGDVLLDIARIAVPFFFLVSGFFIETEDAEKQSRRIWNQVKKLVVLMLLGDLLYSMRRVVLTAIAGGGVKQYLGVLRAWVDPKFLVLNSPLGSSLWVVRFLIYMLLLLLLLHKLHLKKFAFYGIPVVLVSSFVLCKYSQLLFGRVLLPEQVYPWLAKLCNSFVYFFGGYSLHILYRKGSAIFRKGSLTAVLSVIFLGTAVLEGIWMRCAGCNPSTCDYISTFLLVCSIFIGLVSYPDFMGKSCLAKIGLQNSMHIYIIHVLFRDILQTFADKSGVTGVYAYFAPVAVYVLSLLTSMAYIRAKKLVQKEQLQSAPQTEEFKTPTSHR